MPLYAHVPTRTDTPAIDGRYLGPYSPEEMKDLAKRCPDTFSSRATSLRSAGLAQRGCSYSDKAGLQVYEMIRGGEEITLSVVEGGASSGRWPSPARASKASM